MRATYYCRAWKPHYLYSSQLQLQLQLSTQFVFRKTFSTMTSAADIPNVKVGGNASVPVLAYGTGTAWSKKAGDSEISRELVDAIKTAIKLGYHHLDGAEVYNTEPELGVAIKESGVPREKLFVVTKVYPNIDDIPNAIEQSLKKLQLDYVDLYLIHAPFKANSDKELQDTWAAIEKVKEAGKAKEIGVSNYTKAHLETTLKTAKIPPAINQIEFHPYLQHGDLLDYHKEKGIATSAYGPLTPVTRAAGGPLDPILAGLAKKYAVTAGDVAIRWAIERGAIAITTSSKEARLTEYLRTVKFNLTPQEVEQISELGNQHHFRGFWKDKFAADDRT